MRLPAPVLDKILNVLGDALAFDIASRLNLAGDIHGNVFRPVLECVERNHPDWIIELSRTEVANDSFEICALDFGFAIGAPPNPPKRSTTR